MFTKVKDRISKTIQGLFSRKNSCIGIYGSPNAGKTTLGNRILSDCDIDEEFGSTSHIAHETRRAKKHESVNINTDNGSLKLDIVDTPGLATKIDFNDFMEEDMDEETAKSRAKEATEGVVEAVKWLDDLTGIVLVMDATEDPYTQINVTVIGNIEARHIPMLIVANKCDRSDASPDKIKEAFPQHPIVSISALEGTNMDELYSEIARRFR
jgi:hypothetical protein